MTIIDSPNGNGRVGVIQQFRSDGFQAELVKALAGRIDPDFFARVALTTLRKDPNLLRCNPASVLAAVMDAAQFGLLPDGFTGYGYILAYKGDATFLPGYKGLIQLALRGGRVTKLVGRAVYEGDEFDYALGTEEFIRHRPATGAHKGALTHTYAIAWLPDGSTVFEVLDRERIEKIRDMPTRRGQRVGPTWKSDFDEMATKTAVRALFKYLPLEPVAHEAAERTARVDAGLDVRTVDVEGRATASAPAGSPDALFGDEEDEAADSPIVDENGQPLHPEDFGDAE